MRKTLLAVVLAGLLAPVGIAPAQPTEKDTGSKSAFTPKPGKEVRVELPESGTFMLVYTPEDYVADRDWPVIVCYHGYNCKTTTWPIKQVTKGKGFIVLGLEYAIKNFGFDEIEKEVANFNEALKIASIGVRIDRRMVFCGGFSQGGYATTRMVELIGDQLAGGLVLGAGRNLYGREPANRKGMKGLPVFIGAGEKDKHCPPAKRAADEYRRFGAKVTTEYWPNKGHTAETKSEKMLQWLLDNGPLKYIRQDYAKAEAHALAKRVGKALAMYAAIAQTPQAGELAEQAKEKAAALEKRATESLTAARKARDSKDYPTAVRLYARLQDQWDGCVYARKATSEMDALLENPKIKAILEQVRLDETADAMEAKAQAAEKQKNYAEAFRLYAMYVEKYADATRYKAVKAHYDRLRSDEAIVAKLRADKAKDECTAWLNLARNYLNAGMNRQARKYLQKIIAEHPGTSYAKEAKALLKKMGA